MKNYFNYIRNPWFAAMWIGLAVLSYFFADKPIAIFMNQHYDSSFLVPIAQVITHFGIAGYYIIFFLLAFLLTKIVWKKPEIAKITLFFLLIILISGLICDVLKMIMARARPTEWFDHHIYGFYFFNFETSKMWSFPSGHATTIATVMTGASFLWRRFWPIFMLIVLLVAISRLILVAHYLSDVMIGMYLGAIISICIYRIMYAYERKTN
jgi:membrane-associated phospholipid phosphatase